VKNSSHTSALKPLIQVAIPYESRLVMTVRHREEQREMIERSERIARDTGTSTGKVVKVTLAMKAEPGDLRGLPCEGSGIGGSIYGRRPGDDSERAERDERYIERRRAKGDAPGRTRPGGFIDREAAA